MRNAGFLRRLSDASGDFVGDDVICSVRRGRQPMQTIAANLPLSVTAVMRRNLNDPGTQRWHVVLLRRIAGATVRRQKALGRTN